jgi:UDP-glucose 4-epimerase
MRFLITGGTGFVGSHLAEDLLARGQRGHVLDDPSTRSMDSIRHLETAPRFGDTIETCASASVIAEDSVI